MATLWQKSVRDLIAARWQAVGLALLVAAVIALVVGAQRALRMLDCSSRACVERLQSPDLDVRCSPTLPGAIDAVAGMPGLAAAEERTLLDGHLRTGEDASSPAVVRVLPAASRPTLFALELLDGRWPLPDEEAVLVDRSVTRDQGVAPGDDVQIQVHGVTRELRVVGVTRDAEHLLNPTNAELAIPIPGAYSVVYVSEAAGKHYPYADRVNSLLFLFDSDVDPGDMRDRLLGGLGVAVLGLATPETNLTHRAGRYSLRIFEICMPTVVSVFAVVALMLFVITIARIVRTQRRQIGSLLAIGHRRGSIAASLLVLSVVPTVLGGLLGALGHPIVARLMFDRHVEAMGWPPHTDAGAGPELWIAALTCMVLSVIACLLPALAQTRSMPAHLLRGDVSRPAPSRIPGLRSFGRMLSRAFRLPLSVLLGLRSILRRRWVTGVTIVALAANFAMVLAFYFVHVSHTKEVETTFDRLGLDAVAYFDEPQLEDSVRAALGQDWRRVEPTITQVAWFDFDTGASFVRLMCLPVDSWIQAFPLAAGRPFGSGDTRCVYVDRWLARTHGLAVGDRVTCFAYYSAPEGLEVEVAGIFDGVSLGIAAAPLETAREIFQLPDMVTGVHVDGSRSRQETVDALLGLPNVNQVMHFDDARRHVNRSFAGSRFIISLALGFAVAVAVIFLGVLASLDAAEKRRDFAVLRALGWRPRAVLGLCITEVVVRGYAALLLSLPAAPLLALWILHRIRDANYYHLPLHDPLWMYVLVAVLAAALIPLGALPALRAAWALPSRRVLRMLATE